MNPLGILVKGTTKCFVVPTIEGRTICRVLSGSSRHLSEDWRFLSTRRPPVLSLRTLVPPVGRRVLLVVMRVDPSLTRVCRSLFDEIQ